MIFTTGRVLSVTFEEQFQALNKVHLTDAEFIKSDGGTY